MSYSEKLKHPKWQKKRLEILDRDNFTCRKCNDTETTLHVHHLKYENGKDPWEYNKKDLITLCADCHDMIENLKKDLGEDFKFNKCKVLKSNRWDDGSKIIFTSYSTWCSMRIYDSKNNFIIGYNLNNDIQDIINILKITQNA